MKRVLLFSFASLAFLTAVFGQDTTRTWVIRANTGITIGVGNISIEKVFFKHHTFTVSPSFMYFKSEGLTYITYGGGADYRYYFSKRGAPSGFYGGGGASVVRGEVDIETLAEQTDVKGYTWQVIGGHQWILKKGWAIDLNTGIQYLDLKFKNPRASGSAFKGYLPALGVGVGYAF